MVGRVLALSLFVAGPRLDCGTRPLFLSVRDKNVMFHTGEQKTRNHLKPADNERKRRGIFMKSISETV